MRQDYNQTEKEEPLLLHGLIVLSIVSGVFCFLIVTQQWHLFAVPHLNYLFLDMAAVTAAIEGHGDGLNVLVANPYDPLERVHIYSPLWLLGAEVGLTRLDTSWIAALSIISYLALTVYIIRAGNWVASTVTVLFLLSPALLLGMERANTDLIAYGLIVLAIIFASKEKLVWHGLASAFLLVSSLAKFYPFFCLVLFLFYFLVTTKWKESVVYSVSLAIFFTYIFANFETIELIVGNIPNVTGKSTFGGETLFDRIGLSLSLHTRIVTYLGFAISILLAFALAGRLNINWGKNNRLQCYTYFIGVGLLLFCFVVGNSFDYRNIYGLLMLPLLLAWLTCNGSGGSLNRLIAVVCLFGFVFTIWAEWIVQKSDRFVAPSFVYIAESIVMWMLTLPLLMVMFSFIFFSRNQAKESKVPRSKSL